MRYDILACDKYFEYQKVRYRFKVWRKTGEARKTGEVPKTHEAPETGGAVERQERGVPLVLLHGFSQSASSWDTLAPLLAPRHSVYALDLVGHGKSDKPASSLPYTLDAQGAALNAFLRRVMACEAQAKPAVVGYSMGGRVVLSALVANPHLFASCVSALVLESAGLGYTTIAEQADAAKQDAYRAFCLREGGIEAFMDKWQELPLFASQKSLASAVRARIRRDRLANSADALAATFEEAGQHAMPLRAEVFDALSFLAGSNALIAYIAGALDGKYCHLAEAIASLGDVQTKIIDGVGHNVHLEAPELFVDALEGLLFGDIL